MSVSDSLLVSFSTLPGRICACWVSQPTGRRGESSTGKRGNWERIMRASNHQNICLNISLISYQNTSLFYQENAGKTGKLRSFLLSGAAINKRKVCYCCTKHKSMPRCVSSILVLGNVWIEACILMLLKTDLYWQLEHFWTSFANFSIPRWLF